MLTVYQIVGSIMPRFDHRDRIATFFGEQAHSSDLLKKSESSLLYFASCQLLYDESSNLVFPVVSNKKKIAIKEYRNVTF